ncbi:MAG: hypothetical protein JNJ49_06045 [Bdellovibrionaceae bacterium]|nr:hypothetical protein [Pseudobdellovibrionaceae bacterium]
MNSSKTGLLVAAALLGIGSVTNASDVGLKKFTPLESLPPEYRTYYSEKLRDIQKVQKIDWSKFIPGINEKGELILQERTEHDFEAIVQPSSIGG